MVSLTTIETVGYDLAFFKLPETEDNGVVFTYYTFDTTAPPALANEWNLVGLHQRSSEPLLLDVRLINVGDDELSLDAFDPRYANSLLSVNSTEFLALIQFFEERAMDRRMLKVVHPPACFHLLDTEELRQLHLQAWQIGRKEGDSYYKIGDYYHYTPGENVQSSEKMSLLRFPQWSSHYNYASLEFVTFDRARLVDPRFNPFHAVTLEWPGTMTFDQGALEEFILLLKQYTYEQMVGGS